MYICTFQSKSSLILLACCHQVSQCTLQLSNKIMSANIIHSAFVVHIYHSELQFLYLLKPVVQQKCLAKLEGESDRVNVTSITTQQRGL